MNFEEKFNRAYKISMVNIETAMMKLRSTNGKNQIQGQGGGYVRQSGQPTGNNGVEPGSAEVVAGTNDIPPELPTN